MSRPEFLNFLAQAPEHATLEAAFEAGWAAKKEADAKLCDGLDEGVDWRLDPEGSYADERVRLCADFIRSSD